MYEGLAGIVSLVDSIGTHLLGKVQVSVNDGTGTGANFVSWNASSVATHFYTVMFPLSASSAPTYAEGGIYYDTTLHKLRVGGATGWETITST